MLKEDYLRLDGDVRAIIADATCTEILNGDGKAIPGSLVQYPHRNKAVALRLGLGRSTGISAVMFNEVHNSINHYGFSLWPVNRRFTIKTLNEVQTVIVTSGGKLLAELEITDDASLTPYSEIQADDQLMQILNAHPMIKTHADLAFTLENSNWVPVCEIKDYSVESDRSRMIPIDQRVVISTKNPLSDSLRGQAPLIICI